MLQPSFGETAKLRQAQPLRPGSRFDPTIGKSLLGHFGLESKPDQRPPHGLPPLLEGRVDHGP
jgi:hypothetical protein